MKNNLFLKYGSSLSKVLMILLIMVLVIAIVQAITIEVSRTFVMRRTCPVRPIEDESTKIKKSSRRFMPDGTVHQLVYEGGAYYNDDTEKKIKIYDVNDDLIWQGWKKDLPYQYLNWSKSLIGSWNWYDSDTFNERQMRYMLNLEPDLSGSVEFPVRQDGQIEIIWRYLPDEEYFMAFNTEGDIAGYLGSTGFTKQKSNVTAFGRFKLFTAWCPEDSVNPVMLWQTDKKVYQIDFQKQIVETIFQTDKEIKKPISLKNWRFTESNDTNDIKYRPAVLLETPDNGRHLVMRQPNQTFTFTPPDDWDLEEQKIELVATEKNIYLLRIYYGPKLPEEYKYSEKLVNQWWQQRRSKPQQYWEELYTINEKGDLNLINRYDWTVPAGKIRSDPEYDFIKKIKYCVTDFSPPFYNILWRALYKYWPSSLAGSENESIFKLCIAIIQELRSRRAIINWSISLVFVLIALWHGYPRRTNWLTLIIWLAIVALFSLAGFLTYWALNHTTLIKCPVCGKKRHLAQSKCIRCGSDLPSPESKPTDLIFT